MLGRCLFLACPFIHSSLQELLLVYRGKNFTPVTNGQILAFCQIMLPEVATKTKWIWYIIMALKNVFTSRLVGQHGFCTGKRLAPEPVSASMTVWRSPSNQSLARWGRPCKENYTLQQFPKAIYDIGCQNSWISWEWAPLYTSFGADAKRRTSLGYW